MPEDVTEKQLKVSYWWITNKLLIRKIGIGFFIGIDALIWVVILIFLGKYIIGFQKETLMLQTEAGMFNNNAIIAQYNQANKPIDLISSPITLILKAGNKADLVAKISNPNPDWYVKSLSYRFSVGEQTSEERQAFVLPNSEKYLMAFNLDAGTARRAQLELLEIKWKKITKREILDIPAFITENLDIEIVDPKHYTVSGVDIKKGVMSKTEFDVINNTPFNFWEIGLNVILYQQTNIVGINYLEIPMVKSAEKRHVEIGWSERLPFVNRVAVEPDLDVLNPDVFMEFEQEVGEIK
jgi:hypothetical protein